jgi:uridine kinase
MRFADGEPALGPWRVERLAAFVDRLRAAAGTPAGRPAVVAVDGRGSSGKTSLCARIAARVDGAVVVHTDDIAWRHAAFDWAGLLAEGVLEPLRAGRSVTYRPPKWDEHARPGAIRVPAVAPLVLVEGVGAGRRAFAPLLDAVVYVQSDIDEIDRRNAVRVAAGETTPADFASWMAEEMPFVVAERAWERAYAVVCGTPEVPYDRETEVVVAPQR